MERAAHTTAKLTGLIVTVVVIAVLVILIGSVCTCLCTCGSCLGCGGCVPSCRRPSLYGDAQATPEPVPTAKPQTAAGTGQLGDQTPTETASPEMPDGQTPALPLLREKQVKLRNDGTDTVTVLVLMNGSDLESQYGEATADLTEMIRADKSDRVNILVETVGTKNWSGRYGISSRRSQRYRVTSSGLTLVDDSLGQLDTTVPATLSDFIRWGAKNYPADRYILVLWDHGGGPVYGFGYDEFQSYSSTLTIDEMQTSLQDGGVFFDVIGMDCCLMSSVEVASALYDYCDYTLLSEDFEPGCGWEHSKWLSALANDPAIPTPDLAKTLIDASVHYCEESRGVDGGMTLALIDESYVPMLFSVWTEFAYANEETLLSQNYSQLRESTGRVHPLLNRSVSDWFSGEDEYTLSDYYITDVLSLAANIPSDRSDVLSSMLDAAIVYYGATSDERTLAGLSVTLPYGDRAFYNELVRVFRNAGFDEAYITWLGKFVDVQTATGGYYDFGEWSGWTDYFADYDWSGWGDALGDLGGYASDWTYGWGDVAIGVIDWLLGG